MLDSKLLRTDTEGVARNLARRGFQLDVDVFRALEEQRKAAQVESDRVRSERNTNAKAVGMAKGKGEDAGPLLRRGEELTRALEGADAEITVKVARGKFRIFEVPVSYYARSRSEGKKIRLRDGFSALSALARFRFERQA